MELLGDVIIFLSGAMFAGGVAVLVHEIRASNARTRALHRRQEMRYGPSRPIQVVIEESPDPADWWKREA